MNRSESEPSLLHPETQPIQTIDDALHVLNNLQKTLPSNTESLGPKELDALSAIKECHDDLRRQPIDQNSGLLQKIEYIQGLIENLKTSKV